MQTERESTGIRVPVTEEDGMEEIPDETVEALREVFQTLDTDSSGSVSARELKVGLHACGEDLSDQQLQEYMDMFDIDGDGEFSEDEFIECVAFMHANIDPEEMEEARAQAVDVIMKKYDKDGSGCISPAELREVLTTYGGAGGPMTEAECDEMFQDMDSDGSGSISKDELMQYLQDREVGFQVSREPDEDGSEKGTGKVEGQQEATEDGE